MGCCRPWWVAVMNRRPDDDDIYTKHLDELIRKAMAQGDLKHAAFSEDACALAFIDLYKGSLRYVSVTKQWHWWNGKMWVKDNQSRAYAFARDLVRDAASTRKTPERKKASSASFCNGVERLARAD